MVARMPRSLVAALLAVLVFCASALADDGSGGAREPEQRGPEPELRGKVSALTPDGHGISGHGREGGEPAGGPAGRPLDARDRRRATAPTVRASLPDRWCGTERATDDTAHERDNGPWRFHAIYALAADAPDRFAALADTVQTDAFQASALLERLYGRAVRLDMGTDCGPQFLDITVVRLRETTAALNELAGQPTGTLDAVARALDARGMTTAKTGDAIEALRLNARNYAVWLDAPGPADACGQATMESDTDRNPDTNRSNFGGHVAVVFRDGDSFCNSTAARHEMAHTLGAVTPMAPHAVDGAHCSDAYEDTMCVAASPRIGAPLAAGAFDFGNDDYWSPPGGPALGWWTVDESRFLCPDPACNVPGPAQARPRLRATMARHGGRWTLAVRVSGAGRARLDVTCGRVVRRREVAPPVRLRLHVRCASRPRASLSAR
jgi:hypothetical protein